MSAPPPPPPPAGGEGLGQSTPLVTIAGGGPPSLQHGTAGSQQQQLQSFTPVAGNHPLAPPSMPPPMASAPVQIAPGAVPVFQSPSAAKSVEVSLPGGHSEPQIPAPSMSSPPPPPMQQYQQQHYEQKTAPPAPSRQQQPYMASPPPQGQAHQFTSPPTNSIPQPTTTVANINSPTTKQQNVNFGGSSPAQSLDDLVDAFLSGPSYRTEQQLPPLLRPPPLINEHPLQCLRTLVERRAWGDVLQVTADLLRGSDSSHAQIYQTMCNSSGIDDPPATNNNHDSSSQQQQHRDETVEIVALQCHAWLKLRRYTDLGQEIERWNFLPFNDQYDATTAPTWVPWSLRTLFICLFVCLC